MRENVVAYFHFKWTKNRGAGQTKAIRTQTALTLKQARFGTRAA
jgi:hypothetical protein